MILTETQFSQLRKDWKEKGFEAFKDLNLPEKAYWWREPIVLEGVKYTESGAGGIPYM